MHLLGKSMATEIAVSKNFRQRFAGRAPCRTVIFSVSRQANLSSSLRKLRARTCIYSGIGGCFLAMMAWAFRDEPIGLMIALALVAMTLVRSITRLRKIAHLERAANAFSLRGAATDQPCEAVRERKEW